jgi:putative ABC transport system ATP-binding protein
MHIIEIIHASKIFAESKDNQTIALNDASLKIAQGDFVAIMGPSGSGKSTLMNILGLLDVPTSGDYKLDGVTVSQLSDRQLAKLRSQKIGFVFQTFNLLPKLTLQQNVELPMIYRRISVASRHQRASLLLRKVGLAERAKYRPNQVSGGQLQRAAIARALANEPKLILADEPTGNLDSKSGHQIMQLLEALNKAGVTIVMVTHDANIAKFARRIIRVQDGKIQAQRESRI